MIGLQTDQEIDESDYELDEMRNEERDNSDSLINIDNNSILSRLGRVQYTPIVNNQVGQSLFGDSLSRGRIYDPMRFIRSRRIIFPRILNKDSGYGRLLSRIRIITIDFLDEDAADYKPKTLLSSFYIKMHELFTQGDTCIFKIKKFLKIFNALPNYRILFGSLSNICSINVKKKIVMLLVLDLQYTVFRIKTIKIVMEYCIKLRLTDGPLYQELTTQYLPRRIKCISSLSDLEIKDLFEEYFTLDFLSTYGHSDCIQDLYFKNNFRITIDKRLMIKSLKNESKALKKLSNSPNEASPYFC